MDLSDRVRRRFGSLIEARETYERLARDAGITESGMRAIVQGRTSSPKLSTVDTFCRARQLDLAVFLGLDRPLDVAIVERALSGLMPHDPETAIALARAIERVCRASQRHGITDPDDPRLRLLIDYEAHQPHA